MFCKPKIFVFVTYFSAGGKIIKIQLKRKKNHDIFTLLFKIKIGLKRKKIDCHFAWWSSVSNFFFMERMILLKYKYFFVLLGNSIVKKNKNNKNHAFGIEYEVLFNTNRKYIDFFFFFRTLIVIF